MGTIDPEPKYGNVNEIFEGRPGVHMAEKMSNVSSEDIDMRSAGKESNLITFYCLKNFFRIFWLNLYVIVISGDSEDNMNTAPKDMQSKLVTNPASDTSSPGNQI